MKIYLAGPIALNPDYASSFEAAHAEVLSLDWIRKEPEIVNPVHLCKDIHRPATQWEDYMRVCIRELMTCDAIALLPGWQKSEGARLEYSISKSLGLTIVFLRGRL